MNDWWNQHIGLFIKYHLKEKVVIRTSNNIHVMQFKEGALELLHNFYQRQIPVIIISAGIGNFIKQFLFITITIMIILLLFLILYNLRMDMQ